MVELSKEGGGGCLSSGGGDDDDDKFLLGKGLLSTLAPHISDKIVDMFCEVIVGLDQGFFAARALCSMLII